jgi:hypothetical protein
MSKNNKPKQGLTIKHIVTEEDLKNNPELVGEVEVGDEIELPAANKPEEIDAEIAAKKEELAKIDAEIVSRKETMTKTEFVQTETGLVVPKTTVLTKRQHVAEKFDSDSWAVKDENGKIVKIYSTQDGTKAKECERAANNLAKKLSNQFI